MSLNFPLFRAIVPAPGAGACLFEGELFEDEEEWFPDACTLCRCSRSSVVCDTQECPPIACTGHPVLPPGKCCPVCPGTVADREEEEDEGEEEKGEEKEDEGEREREKETPSPAAKQNKTRENFVRPFSFSFCWIGMKYFS